MNKRINRKMGVCVDGFFKLNDALESCSLGCTLWMAKKFKIEELASSAIFEEDKVITGLQGSAIIALMRESRQMLNVIRFAGYYMLVLTLIYFV